MIDDVVLAERLRIARTLIENGWTRDYYARDLNGDPVEDDDSSAVCFCAVGAARRVDRLACDLNRTAQKALYEAADVLGKKTPVQINDEQGKLAVLQLYDLAIRRATSP